MRARHMTLAACVSLSFLLATMGCHGKGVAVADRQHGATDAEIRKTVWIITPDAIEHPAFEDVLAHFGQWEPELPGGTTVATEGLDAVHDLKDAESAQVMPQVVAFTGDAFSELQRRMHELWHDEAVILSTYDTYSATEGSNIRGHILGNFDDPTMDFDNRGGLTSQRRAEIDDPDWRLVYSIQGAGGVGLRPSLRFLQFVEVASQPFPSLVTFNYAGTAPAAFGAAFPPLPTPNASEADGEGWLLITYRIRHHSTNESPNGTGNDDADPTPATLDAARFYGPGSPRREIIAEGSYLKTRNVTNEDAETRIEHPVPEKARWRPARDIISSGGIMYHIEAEHSAANRDVWVRVRGNDGEWSNPQRVAH